MRKLKKSAVALALLFIYIFSLTPLSVSAEYIETAGKAQDVQISSRIYELIFGKETKRSDGELRLIPGGDAFGIKITEDHPTVARVDGESELLVGDKLLAVNGKSIESAQDIHNALAAYSGGKLVFTVQRNGEKMTLSVTPCVIDGEARLNVALKQASSGIGTITFIEPESRIFGGLGHAVCDSTGKVLELCDGLATSVILTGVKRGESGKPGELCGVLGRGHLGRISINSECGVFGVLDCRPLSKESAIPVGMRDSVKLGEAEIISTLKNGKKANYTIEITDIDYSSTTSKSFKIRVTDDALLAISGGIVRGMSGSPIIQDGKLIGAVTHVMVADPTEGYGIFIENMLNASVSTRNELPAA